MYVYAYLMQETEIKQLHLNKLLKRTKQFSLKKKTREKDSLKTRIG